MGNKSSVQKYYRVLFKLPSRIILVLFSLIFTAALYIVINNVMAFIASLVLIILSALLLLISRLVISKNPFSTPRRVLGYVMISSFILLIVLSITRILHATTYSTIVLASISGLISFLLLGAGGFNKKTLVYVFLVPTILSYVTYMFKHSFPVFIYGFTPSMVSMGITYYVARHKVKGIDVLSIGYYFLRYKLNGEKTIEKIFSKLAASSTVRAHILSSRNTAVIYTDVHYGPFGDIGSSDLPSILDKMLSEENYTALILHGMGSHDRNIASRECAVKYASNIAKTVMEKKDSRECIPLEVFVVKEGEWSAVVYLFSCIAIAFLYRLNGGIDDLPYSLQEYAWKKSLKEDVPPLILVDSHNSELTIEPDIDNVYKLVDKIIDMIKQVKLHTMVYCIGIASGTVNNTEGVINENISVWVLKIGEKKACLLYIPGNNMEPGVRDKLVETMIKNGCDIAEAITNDEHIETGVLAGDAYKPVSLSSELLEKTSSLVRRALNDCVREKLYYSSIVDEVPLMGNIIWRLKWLLEKLFYRVMMLSLINIFLTPIVLTLIIPL